MIEAPRAITVAAEYMQREHDVVADWHTAQLPDQHS
jgi:hypothetical protein